MPNSKSPAPMSVEDMTKYLNANVHGECNTVCEAIDKLGATRSPMSVEEAVQSKKGRKKRMNILRLHVNETRVDEFFGERLLCIDTSISNWRIALGEKDVVALRSALDAFAPEPRHQDLGDDRTFRIKDVFDLATQLATEFGYSLPQYDLGDSGKLTALFKLIRRRLLSSPPTTSDSHLLDTGDEYSKLVNEVQEWQRATFPHATPKSAAAHLRSEADELLANPTDTEEMADVLMLLMCIAGDNDLLAATRRKLEINKKRVWGQRNSEGFVEHVRPVPSTGDEDDEFGPVTEAELEGAWTQLPVPDTEKVKTDYRGKVRLFRVDDDGEFFAFAATSEGDAMYRHIKRWHDDTGDIPEPGCEVSEYPPDEMIEVGGDDPEADIPEDAHFDKERRLACATAAQWAAKYEADGGSEYAVFQSIY